MSKIVFRNYDTKSLKALLKEVGEKHYKAALKEQNIEQKPLSMNGFFVEYETHTHNINLYHRYPSGVTLYIMPVLGFWAVPEQGWVMYRKD